MEKSVNNRILDLIFAKKMNKNSFSNYIGVSPQTIHNIVGERQSKPSYDVLMKIISSFKDIDPTWLITGKGNMSTVDSIKEQTYDTSDVKKLTSEVEYLRELNRMLLGIVDRNYEVLAK